MSTLPIQLLWRWLTRLGVNAVPLWGILFGNWNAPTALVVYWFENLAGSLLIALRIYLHRRATRKRGHFRPQLGVRVSTGSAARRNEREIGSFLAEFVMGSLVFTLAHGLFLLLILAAILSTSIDGPAVAAGVAGVLAFQLVGCATDLIGLRERPFAWIKEMAQYAMGRVVLIHLAIIAGVGIAAFSGNNESFLLPFALLKLLADIGSLFGNWQYDPETPPAWLVRAMNRLRPGEDFAAYWAEERAREREQALANEEVSA